MSANFKSLQLKKVSAFPCSTSDCGLQPVGVNQTVNIVSLVGKLDTLCNEVARISCVLILIIHSNNLILVSSF